MLHKTLAAGGVISLGLILISCSPAAPQAEIDPTDAPAPTLDLPVEELNDQMFEAIRSDDVDQLVLLIASGADIETKDAGTGATPLVIASLRGDVTVVEALLAAGADVNGTDRGGITPLMNAAQSGHAALIPILIEAGADPDILSTSGFDQNALHMAAKNGHVEAVAALLTAGADVDALENTHSTALMYAAYWGHTEVVELLLEHGADTAVLDNGGHTAAEWADTRGYPEIAEIIRATE